MLESDQVLLDLLLNYGFRFDGVIFWLDEFISEARLLFGDAVTILKGNVMSYSQRGTPVAGLAASWTRGTSDA